MRSSAIFLLGILLLPFLLLKPQENLGQMNRNNGWEAHYKRVDSLLSIGLPQSAQDYFQKNIQSKIKPSDKDEFLKAEVYTLYLSSFSHESDTTVVSQVLREVKLKKDPVSKAIWSNIAAKVLHNYYMSNSWAIRQRSELEVAGDDFSQWSAGKFEETIEHFYTQSIEPKELLQSISIKEYSAIVTNGVNVDEYSLSLYDILAYSYLEYLGNAPFQNVTYFGKVQIPYDAIFFTRWSDFVKIDLGRFQDGRDNKAYKSLAIYQELLSNHYNSGNTGYALYLDIERLALVKSMIGDAAADDYKSSLNHLVSKYNNYKESDLAKVRLLEIQYEEALNENPAKTELTVLAKELEQVYDKTSFHPAKSKAALLLNRVYSKDFRVEFEEVILPHTNAKMYVSYCNTPKIDYAIYQVSVQDYLKATSDNKKLIARGKLVKQGSITLPQSEDMRRHSTEVLMGNFSEGLYLFVAGFDGNRLSENAHYSKMFSVSNLAIAYLHSNSGLTTYYIMDRTTGLPISSGDFILLDYKYDSKKSTYYYTEQRSLPIGTEGQVMITEAKYSENNYLIRQGKDTILGHLYKSFGAPHHEVVKSSLIFTDRAVYRPGQVIKVKGIVYEDYDADQKKVLAGYKTKVVLYDANGQEVSDAQEVITNEFGSYFVEFVIPEGRLNGTYRIRDGVSIKTVRVEEYKRPQFFVEFEQLDGDYRLGSNVIVGGYAKTYSGVGMAEVPVRYTVYRNRHFPYWRPYARSIATGREQVSYGVVQTDASGRFAIPIALTPDREDKPEDGIRYSYSVVAEVVDISGEMQSSELAFTAGFQPFMLQLDIPQVVVNDKTDQINIAIVNHAGLPLQRQADITLYKLQYPGIFRKRLWPKPSIQQFSRDEHRALFPLDEYEDESDPAYWQKEEIANFKGIQPLRLHEQLSSNIFKEPGYYAIEVSTVDDRGVRITDRKVFYYYRSGQKTEAETPLLIATNIDQARVGDKLETYLLSALGATKSILLFEGNLKREDVNWTQPSYFKRNVNNDDRGHRKVTALTVRNGRVYTSSITVNVPWVDRTLDISWATHRNTLYPGAEEEWSFTIRDYKQKTPSVEFLGVLYDMSLDKIAPMYWHDGSSLLKYYSNYGPRAVDNFGVESISISGYDEYYKSDVYYWKFPQLSLPIDKISFRHFFDLHPQASYSVPLEYARSGNSKKAAENVNELDNSQVANSDEEGSPQIDLRTDFSETAFFIPNLVTDANGEIKFKFTMPQSLTTWKFLGFAHTKDMKSGNVSGSVVTQKDLMIQPNIPRFFRQKDEVVLRARVSNLSVHTLNGKAKLDILDPNTKQSVADRFGLSQQVVDFVAESGGLDEVSWNLKIPADWLNPVIVRVTATAENFTDGEEHLIPVLTNQVFVTESWTLPFTGSGEKRIRLDRITEPSSTRIHAGLTFEFAANPTWYVVQALPYLMEYPYECSEQTFNKLYANAVSHKILHSNPAISEVLKQWRAAGDSTLTSALQKNEVLKTALLQETPWVQEAMSETEQKQRTALLFDTDRVNKELSSLTHKLKELQNPDGSWSWFPGMGYNPYITNYILIGWGKLSKMGAITPEMSSLEPSVKNAVQFSDRQLVKQFEDLKALDKNWKTNKYFSTAIIQYFYMRSFYEHIQMNKATQEAYSFFFSKSEEHWDKMSLLLKAQMSVVLYRKNDQRASKLIQSIYENSVYNEELGRYWPKLSGGWYWYEAPVETQATIIEAFAETGLYPDAVDEMKIWLLKRKQTSHWNTTTGTADACYALLANGSDWLASSPSITAMIGKDKIELPAASTEAGTGYFVKQYTPEQVTPDKGDIKINVVQPEAASKRPSWGAVYWQYFDDADKVTAHSGELSVERKLYLNTYNSGQKVLKEIDAQTQVQPGDKITVRLVVKVDRDLEFVHLKDQRAAGLEPIDVRSGRVGIGSLWAYRNISDASVSYFFDYLPKGVHVMEYELKVNASGKYNHGLATIECMYAPEFSAHTAGFTPLFVK